MTTPEQARFEREERIRTGVREAARQLLAEGTRSNVNQVHEIVLRDVDANEEHPRILHLIPLGPVIGVAVTADGEEPADKDILFVAAAALGSSLPALGFTVRHGLVTYVRSPGEATPERTEPEP